MPVRYSRDVEGEFQSLARTGILMWWYRQRCRYTMRCLDIPWRLELAFARPCRDSTSNGNDINIQQHPSIFNRER
jgi:hypothetical protein